jgi:DNA-binding Lrp family transcriptional regulator
MIKCYLDDDDDIGHFVTENIQKIDGVRDTFTIIAFKAFS